MLTKADILFGKIAIKAGMCSEEQIDECVRLQEEMEQRKPLGMIMLEKSYITEEQLQRIIEIQKQNLQEKAINSRTKRDDGMFGRIVLKLGFASEEQVHDAVRIQAKIEEDIFLRLGEIMVKKGYLTNEQVSAVLEYQRTKIVVCPDCQTQFNVIMFTEGTELRCYKCGAHLKVPDKLTHVAAEEYKHETRKAKVRDDATRAPVVEREEGKP
jgi:Zn ribbon nucleic-acid-binding protein